MSIKKLYTVGGRTGMSDILLASKVITQDLDTTYHLYLGEFV